MLDHAGHGARMDTAKSPSKHLVETDAQAHVETSIDPAKVENTPYTEQVPDNRECTSPLAVSSCDSRSNVSVICDFAGTDGEVEDNATPMNDHEDANHLTALCTIDFKKVRLS